MHDIVVLTDQQQRQAEAEFEEEEEEEEFNQENKTKIYERCRFGGSFRTNVYYQFAGRETIGLRSSKSGREGKNKDQEEEKDKEEAIRNQAT